MLHRNFKSMDARFDSGAEYKQKERSMDRYRKILVIVGTVIIVTAILARGEETYPGSVKEDVSKTAPGQAKENGADKKDGAKNSPAKNEPKGVHSPWPDANDMDFIVVWSRAANANKVTAELQKQCEEVCTRMREKFYAGIDSWTWDDFMLRMKIVAEMKKIDKVHGLMGICRPDESSPFVAWIARSPNTQQLCARINEIGKSGLLGSSGYKYILAQYADNNRMDDAKRVAFYKAMKSGTPSSCQKAAEGLLGGMR